MSNITSSLEKLQRIDGFIGAALVDSDSGMTLGVLGGNGQINLEVAAAGNTEVVRSKRKTMGNLNLRDEIEDILITLGKQYHLIRPMRSRNGVFFYLALDRARANLALARMALADCEKDIQLLSEQNRELLRASDVRKAATMRVGPGDAALDLYLTLQISPATSAVDIRRAHRRLVRRHHPDRIQGDARAREEAERHMKAINHAASVLLDPGTRSTYDTLRGGRSAPPTPRPEPRPEPAWYDAPPTPPREVRATEAQVPGWRERADAWMAPLAQAQGPRSLWALAGGALVASMLVAMAAPLLGGPIPVSSPDYRLPPKVQRETMWASAMR